MTTEGEERIAKMLEEIRKILFYLAILEAAIAAEVGVQLVAP